MIRAGVEIAQESPHQADVGALLEASDALAMALYPPESNHLVDVNALALPSVRFVVARIDGRAAGCGAVRRDGVEGELKRMFVADWARGHGLGRAILSELEVTASADGLSVVRLETGVRNHEALALYRRAGYREIGPFGSYGPDPLSVFMEKILTPG
jgi:putative acetyltransferase